MAKRMSSELSREGMPRVEAEPRGGSDVRFADAQRVVDAFRDAPRVDGAQFRRDVEESVDQTPDPRP